MHASLVLRGRLRVGVLRRVHERLGPLVRERLGGGDAIGEKIRRDVERLRFLLRLRHLRGDAKDAGDARADDERARASVIAVRERAESIVRRDASSRASREVIDDAARHLREVRRAGVE